MAMTSSPAVFAISVSSGSPLKAKRHNDSASFYSQNAFRYNPLSTRPAIPRKSCGVRATVLQDNEEKVVVEESFPVKTSPDNGGKGGGREPPESSSLERWVIKIEQSINIFLTDTVIKILDTLYSDRNYARFFVLETIARVPYFGFMSVLHMYESFGWWRRADYLKVHFAESWNEMHHLLIMEELGGNAWWVDRFLAQHIAIFYYFMTVLMYVISPRMAYHFSECVERHAFETYDKFIKAQGGELEKLPAPEIAVKYYTGDDLYLFDEFQTARVPNTRRPKIANLYDVFLNIRDDEAEHCKTMKACQTHGNLRSPHSYAEEASKDDSKCDVPQADCEDWSRQEINYSKSFVHFSSNMEAKRKEQLSHFLQIQPAQVSGKYLSLPLEVSRSRRQACSEIQAKMDKRLAGWKARSLSQAGHTVLLQYVAMALPLYYMSVFLLPKQVCRKLDAQMKNFWWDFDGLSRRFHPNAWDNICKLKECGGLGLRRMEELNRALVAKLGWQMATTSDRLWVSALKEKCCRGRQFMAAPAPPGASWIWQGIMKTKELVKARLCWCVKDGATINLWSDQWVPDLPGFIPSLKQNVLVDRSINTVKDLIDPFIIHGELA